MSREDIVDVESIFIQEFTTSGSSQFDCDCGKEHVAMDSYYWEDADIAEQIRKELEERAEIDENLVLHYDEESVDILRIDNRMWVADCDCKGWLPYYNFIFNNRRQITYFLHTYAQDLEKALEQEKLVHILQGKTEELGHNF